MSLIDLAPSSRSFGQPFSPSPPVRTGQAHRTLIGHTGPVTCLQFDETHIVSGSLDKTLRIWDLRMGGAAVETLRYEYPVMALQFDSRKIVACTGENGIEVRPPPPSLSACDWPCRDSHD